MPAESKGSVFITGGVQRKALAAALALRSEGIRVTVGDPSRLALSLWSLRVDRRVIYPDPEKDENGFVEFLLNDLRRNPVDLLFPTGGEGEINAVYRHLKRFEEVTRVGLSPGELFRITDDKHLLTVEAMKAGVNVPASWCPETVEEALDRRREYPYPVLLKPRTASGARGIVRVNSADEFATAYPESFGRQSRPLIQEYVPVDGYGIAATTLFDFDSKPVIVFSYRRLREFPVNAGPSTFTESTHDPEVKEQAVRILTALGWQGLAMVEFRRDRRDGKAKLLEINGRYWASAKLPIVCGINFPHLYYQMMMGRPVTPPATYPAGIRCRWLFPADVLHFLTNPRRWEMDPPFFQFWARNTCYDPAIWPDPLPTLGQIAWSVRHLFNRETVKRYLTRR